MSIDQYNTIKKTSKSEIVEKKSRFICEIRRTESVEEASLFFDEIKKKYWDARHNCTAFVVGCEQKKEGSSDDGEPSGTAGKPMLEMLLGSELTNVAAIVTRYFGGTLLGTGGLVRAYSTAVRDAINNAEIVTYKKGEEWNIETDYASFGKIQNLMKTENAILKNIMYEANVKAVINASTRVKDRLKEKLIDITSGNIKLDVVKKDVWIEMSKY